MNHAPMRDGAALHYYTLGRGPTVVLLHGFAMPAFLWLPFVAPLAARYRLVLPDLRGFGGSHRLSINGGNLLDQHANDLQDLLGHLGQSQVILGGLSMGACTALQYQRRHGMAGVSAYVHMDQSPCVLNTPEWQHGLLGKLQSPLMGEWRALMLAMQPYRGQKFSAIPAPLRKRLWGTLSVFFKHAMARWPWAHITGLARHEALIRQVAPVSNWPIYMDALHSYLHEDYDWRPSLPQMPVPMTAFVGMRSTMYAPEGQLQLAQFAPSCEVVRFKQAGHAIPFDSPVEFTWQLGKFLAQHRPSVRALLA